MSEYKTVKKQAFFEYEDRRSRFIGAVIPIKTEAEAIEFINRRRSETFGARHNVYAYILREGNIARYSDDGEPHSTAGMPTLDVIKKNGLVDVCVVTTRYFGGILLGTGGLVHAYTTAAKMAIETAGIAVMKRCFLCSVNCEYTDHKRLEQVLCDNKAKVVDTEYTDKVTLKFTVPEPLYDTLLENTVDAMYGKVSVEILESIWADSAEVE
ncbi:MAG: YigZ family protein [Ruminococcaceae bacterium]|nr:YigZ family protein [Oscillospiraceae bacterium]